MVRGRLLRLKPMVLVPWLLALAFIVACGGDPGTPTPVTGGLAPTPNPLTPTAIQTTPGAAGLAVATPVPQSSSVPAPASQAKYGGTVPMHAYAAPGIGQPLIEASYSHLQNLSPLYNGLLMYDPETDDTDDLVCDLCTGWEVSEDGQTFTYLLHPDANWSDGTPVTADDVVFTFESIVDPDQFGDLWEGHKTRPHTGLVKPYYESSQAIDDKTVEITLKFPARAWHPTIALQGMKIAPRHIILGQGKMQGLANPQDLVTSGPFRHVNFVSDVSNEYVRNEDYFKEGRPFIDGMVQFIIVDPASIIAAFAAEEVLMTNGNVDNLSNIESRQFQDDHGDRYNVYFQSPAGAYHVMMNAEKSPFNDPRVRRAVILAINRQEIIETFSGGDYLLGLPFPPGTWYGRTLEEAEQVKGYRLVNGEKPRADLIEARRLMEEAGFPFPKGFQTTITLRRTLQYVEVGTAIAKQLETNLGIKSVIRVVDSAEGQAAFLAGDYNYTVQGSGLAYSGPDSAFRTIHIDGGLLGDTWARGQKTTTWAEIQDIFALQAREPDREKRMALIRQASDLMLEDHPLATIFWTTSTFNIHKKIQNWHPNPGLYASSMMHEHIWCDPRC